MQQSRIFVGMVLILIFGEVLGLYGYDEPLQQNDLGANGCIKADCRSDTEHKHRLEARVTVVC